LRNFRSGTEDFPVNVWTLKLQRDAQREYDALADSIHEEALSILSELAEGLFLEDALPMRGNRNHFRLRFHADQLIFRVSHSQQKVVVTRIGPRNDATYKGYEVD
jgi:mRNA-degrading endonuclease RelE of RelBE toxin-antitoxin system